MHVGWPVSQEETLFDGEGLPRNVRVRRDEAKAGASVSICRRGAFGPSLGCAGGTWNCCTREDVAEAIDILKVSIAPSLGKRAVLITVYNYRCIRAGGQKRRKQKQGGTPD